MNKELKEYIDGIVAPSILIAKRIYTGEKVRELCENIERAVKEVYGKSSLYCYDELEGGTVDAEQIYYFRCIEPTSTTGGYFACVYLYMEDDFMDSDTYETTIEIMFSETEPKLDEHYAYDIWGGPESTVKIAVEPDDWSISYTPLNDPERYLVMSGDIERIKKFVNIVNDRTWKNPDPLQMAIDKMLGHSFGNVPKNFGGAFCLPTLTKPHVEYKPDEFVNNEDKNICAECGGGCCKSYAGAYHPADFRHEITEEFLESLFDPAIEIPPVSIDWYENFEEPDRKGFYIRPRHVGGDEVDPSYGASCALLTPTGCSLDWDHRPWQCRALKPEKNHVCGGPDGKRLAAEAWNPYHDILEKLYNKYNKNTFTGEKPSFSDFIKEVRAIFNEEE